MCGGASSPGVRSRNSPELSKGPSVIGCCCWLPSTSRAMKPGNVYRQLLRKCWREYSRLDVDVGGGRARPPRTWGSVDGGSRSYRTVSTERCSRAVDSLPQESEGGDLVSDEDVLHLRDIRENSSHVSRRLAAEGTLYRCPSCGVFCAICRRRKKCCLRTDPRQGGDTLHPTLG